MTDVQDVTAAVAPLGEPTGLDWRLLLALPSSVGTKENAIAALGVLCGAADRAGRAATQRACTMGGINAWHPR